MSLIKKTIVLAFDKPKGYVTVIRLGSETGAKIVGETFTSDMVACLKLGTKTERVPLQGKKTEIELSASMENGDELSCVVFNETVVATGGKPFSQKEIEKLLSSYLEEKTAPSSLPSNAETEPGLAKESEIEQTLVKEQNESQKENINAETVVKTIAETKAEDAESEKEEKREQEQNFMPDTKEEETKERKEFLQRLVGKDTDFYIGISDKVDEMFVVYPEEKELAKIIPDSEWVRINYDGDDYYVIGRLRDEGKVKYLGYGVPGREDVKPPKVAEGIASWIPTEVERGYWIFFQSASTGEIDNV